MIFFSIQTKKMFQTNNLFGGNWNKALLSKVRAYQFFLQYLHRDNNISIHLIENIIRFFRNLNQKSIKKKIKKNHCSNFIDILECEATTYMFQILPKLNVFPFLFFSWTKSMIFIKHIIILKNKLYSHFRCFFQLHLTFLLFSTLQKSLIIYLTLHPDPSFLNTV